MLVPSYYLNSIAAPLRPTTTLNTQAAARFIGHSLSHLTSGTYLNIKFMCIFGYYGLDLRVFFCCCFNNMAKLI